MEVITRQSSQRWREIECNRNVVLQKDTKTGIDRTYDQWENFKENGKNDIYTYNEKDTFEHFWDTYEERWLGKFHNNRKYRKQKGQVEAIFLNQWRNGAYQGWNIGKEEVLYIIAKQYFWKSYEPLYETSLKIFSFFLPMFCFILTIYPGSFADH